MVIYHDVNLGGKHFYVRKIKSTLLFLPFVVGIFFLLLNAHTIKAEIENLDNEVTEQGKLDAEESEEEMDPDEANTEELSWVRSDSLRISKGPTLKYADGSSAVPILYFGDYTMAANSIKLRYAFSKDVHDSHAQGRVDSLTAPNSLIITIPKGGKFENGPNKGGNHIYGNTYGDAHDLDGSSGSKGNFVTTDIYDLESPSDRLNKPSVAGPDVLNQKYSMLDVPTFSYRIDPKTGYEEQRMIFYQQVKRNKRLYEVEVKIIQKFDKNGRVLTKIAYSNTGERPIQRFMGFAFKDFSLTKDFSEIRDGNYKKVGDFIPLRALGNGRGVYLQSGIIESRYNLFTNLPNGPSSWSGRSISKSHDQQKGFSNGFLGIGSESRFPWAIGDGSISNGFYVSPDVPKGLRNSFSDMNDLGDAGFNLNAGARLGRVGENERAWDSGFAMHTKPQTLEVGSTIFMNYASQIDIIGTKFAPVIELDQKGTTETPDIVQSGAENFRITGNWYDFDSTDVKLFYGIDIDDARQGNFLNNLNQSEENSKSGKPQEWSSSIPINDLKEGQHTVKVWIKDSDGNLSEIAQTVFNVTAPPTIVPTLNILSPESSNTAPYDAKTNNLSLTGTWSDKDSKKMKSATYKIDNDPEEILYTDFTNERPGSTHFWELPELSINKYNDLKIHKITFTIEDYDDNSTSESFYFQHQDGNFQLVTPHSIDFGTEHLSKTSSKKITPVINGTLQVHDFRSKNQSPLKVTLSIDPFTNESDERKTLDHKFYWNDQAENDHEFFIANTPAASSEKWLTTTNLTDLIKKNIKLNFKSNDSTTAGTYNSKWTWKAVESI